jgi:predicted nucleic acid-binding Zn ribbon protein
MAQYSMQDALRHLVDNSTWGTQLKVIRIKDNWETIVGKTIARYTDQLQVNQGVLYVRCAAGPVKSELNYNKKELAQKVNEFLQENFIHDVVVR